MKNCDWLISLVRYGFNLFIYVKKGILFLTCTVGQIFKKNNPSPCPTIYYTSNDKQLSASEVKTFNFSSGFLLQHNANPPLIKIVRDANDTSVFPAKCDYTFPAFYIGSYKCSLNDYFVQGNIFDKSFLIYIAKKQHWITIKRDEELNPVIYVDHQFNTNVMELNTQIRLLKNTYVVEEKEKEI